jgi:hypothetical protein
MGPGCRPSSVPILQHQVAQEFELESLVPVRARSTAWVSADRPGASLRSMPELASTGGEALDDGRLIARYRQVRSRTEALAEPLGPEWSMVQATSQCSPTKWHLAHTTWFFDRFILGELDRRPARREIGFDPDRLLNSYYQSIGETLPPIELALLDSPSAASVLEYR